MSQNMHFNQADSVAVLLQGLAAADEKSAETFDAPAAPDDARFEKLRNDVAAGLMYAHGRENANTSKVLEVASFSYALIELLMERGVISVEELDERKRQVGQRLA